MEGGGEGKGTTKPSEQWTTRAHPVRQMLHRRIPHLNEGKKPLSPTGTRPVRGVKYSMKYFTTHGEALPLSWPDNTMN